MLKSIPDDIVYLPGTNYKLLPMKSLAKQAHGL